MKRIGILLTAGAVLALASCSATPLPAPSPVAPVLTVAAPTMAPYRWSHGHAPKAYQAMVASFGRTGLKPGEYLWATAIPKDGDTRLVVDLLTQMAYVYRGEQL
ncbi:MAG: lipoprotein, partial [Pseudomonadota bacterium]|nr:lipoprotein [Pseudomonadota bacterium]